MTNPVFTDEELYGQADALLKKWNHAWAHVYSAQQEVKNIISAYKDLGYFIKPEESEEFDQRLSDIRASNMEVLGCDYAAAFDVLLPLDIDNRFPEPEQPKAKRARKRAPLNSETVAA